MYISIYYFILSFLSIYIIHQFILYLKNTFTIPKVLDVTHDFNIHFENTHVPIVQSNLNQQTSTSTDDMDELTNYLQNITT